jgi:DNA-binding LacI/PurR family transcriptional regulator
VRAGEIGRQTGKLVLASLHGDKPNPRSVDVGYELIVRSST